LIADVNDSGGKIRTFLDEFAAFFVLDGAFGNPLGSKGK
jgi:hypothetical protein